MSLPNVDKEEKKRFVSYLEKEGIKPQTYFWWEKLPILKHLATKRLAAKMSDGRLEWILVRLGYNPTPMFDENGQLYLEQLDKPKNR